MPRLKEAEDINVEELDVEWSDSFVSYDGEIPPAGTILNGQITKAWWTYSGDNTAMIKVLFVADDTNGEYEGCPAWENMVLKPSAAFKYGPFLEFFGITLKEVKSKTFVAEDDDNQGAPIEKIGTWEPGSDDAYCAIIVKRGFYQGKMKCEVGGWMEYEEPEDAEPEPEPEPARPARTRRSAPAAAAKEAEPAPRRGRRMSAQEVVEPEEEPEEEAPARPARGRRAAAKPAASKPAATPARGRGRRAPQGSSEEPPF
jgi:hypothetical protein